MDGWRNSVVWVWREGERERERGNHCMCVCVVVVVVDALTHLRAGRKFDSTLLPHLLWRMPVADVERVGGY